MDASATMSVINERLRDARGGKVVFVAHCILNQNARVQAGAFAKGGVDPIVDGLQQRGIGIVQMKCPERLAWGGVERPYLWLPAVGAAGSPLYRMRSLTLKLFRAFTRLRVRGVAREVVGEIADLRSAGVEVLGIIGIGGSPSCGVSKTFDMRRAFEYLAQVKAENLELAEVNRHAFRECIIDGRGIFIDELVRGLTRRGLSVPLFEHDVTDEMDGRAHAVEV